MKLVILAIFLSFECLAADCHLFQLKGNVEEKNGFRITINEGTNSEKYFVFPKSLDLRMAVYTKKFVEGKFILKAREPVSGAEILAVDSTDLGVPDPLHHHEEIKYLKKVSCPGGKKS